MKKSMLYIGAALAVLVACKEENPGERYQPGPQLGILSGGVTVFEAAGGQAQIVLDTQTPVIADAERPWLTASTSGHTVTLTAEPNDDIESRYSDLIIIAGDLSRTLTIQQMGRLTIYGEQEDWLISTAVSDEYAVTVSVDVPASDGEYYLFVVSADDVAASGAGENISLFLSLDNNGAVRKLGQPVHTGSFTYDAGTLDRGKYYVVVVGLEDDAVNYTYASSSFLVLYPYDRWLGVWSAEGKSSETWTIRQGVQDASYLIYGVGGADELPTLAVFDEATGGFSISEQENVGTQVINGDECDMSLYGCIDYNGGHPYWGDGKVILTTTLGADWESGTVTAGSTGSSYGDFTGYAYYGLVEGEVEYWLGFKDMPQSLSLTRR